MCARAGHQHFPSHSPKFFSLPSLRNLLRLLQLRLVGDIPHQKPLDSISRGAYPPCRRSRRRFSIGSLICLRLSISAFLNFALAKKLAKRKKCLALKSLMVLLTGGILFIQGLYKLAKCGKLFPNSHKPLSRKGLGILLNGENTQIRPKHAYGGC